MKIEPIKIFLRVWEDAPSIFQQTSKFLTANKVGVSPFLPWLTTP